MGQTEPGSPLGGTPAHYCLPMTTSVKPAAAGGQTGIGRLLEAEREWQQQLELARAEAARIIAAALAAGDADLAAFESQLPQIIAERRGHLEEETRRAAADLTAQLQHQIDRYAKPDDAFIESMAARLAMRAPWFATAVEGES